jgi:hypothetical protein
MSEVTDLNARYRNYWSLHADFVHDFSTVRHKGFSLPLLIPFHRLIRHPDIEAHMQDPSLAAKHTRNSITEDAAVQPFFDRYIKRNVPLKRYKNGKIVLCLTLLRFPHSIGGCYLSPENTIHVGPGFPSPKDGPNVIGIKSFLVKKDPEWPNIKAKAELLLARHAAHPVFGHPHFREMLLEYLEIAAGAVNGVTWLFERHKIAAVVVGATNEPVGRALAIMAHRRRIPSIATQHGLIGNELGFLPVFVSRLAVFGNNEVEFYTSRGVPARHIFVTGHPRFDTFFTNPAGDRKAFLAKYGVSPDKKTVLVMTNQIRDMAAWSAYIGKLAKHPDVAVLIKPHKNEVMKNMLDGYYKLAKAHPNVKVLAERSIHLKNILPLVDAAVAELSTTGLESIICGTPTLFLRKPSYEDINHKYYYEKMDEFVSTDPDYLAKLTYAVLKQPSVRKRNVAKMKAFLRHAYPVDLSGEALTRVLSRLTRKILRRPVARKYEGMLVKGTGPEIYYVRGQVKRRIPSPKVMVKHKFDPKHVKRIPDAELMQIPPGAVLT